MDTLSQDENRHLLKQRASAMATALAGTAIGAIVAIIQITYVFGLADPVLFTANGVRVSGLLNLGIFPVGLAFFAVNHRAKRKWQSHEVAIYRISLLIFFIAFLFQGLGHVHNAGLANSAISGYFIMIVTLAAWFLPSREFQIFSAITIMAGTALALLETGGVIPYAPIFAESEHITEIFQSPEIIFGSYAMVVIWIVLIGWIVRYVRWRLVGANIELERKVAERSAALEQARNKEKTLHAQLAHVSKVASLGELTASIAHELNQPLAAIMNNASAGRRMAQASSAPDLHGIDEVFSDILADNRRAAQAIQALRGLFRFGEITREPVSLADVVEDVLTLTRGEATQHGIGLAIRIGPDLPVIQADRVQLDHLLLNLLRNAMDALRQRKDGDRQIEIVAKTEGQSVVLSVQDTGPGFPAELLPKLFESFVTTKANGLGIGLSLCQTIAKRHGGSITAANRPDRGADIRVTLPVTSGGDTE